MARFVGPMGKSGTPEPTALVAAAVLLCLGLLLVIYYALGLRCGQLGIVIVLAHLLARKPNVKSKATFVAKLVGATTRTPFTALAQRVVD